MFRVLVLQFGKICIDRDPLEMGLKSKHEIYFCFISTLGTYPEGNLYGIFSEPVFWRWATPVGQVRNFPLVGSCCSDSVRFLELFRFQVLGLKSVQLAHSPLCSVPLVINFVLEACVLKRILEQQLLHWKEKRQRVNDPIKGNCSCKFKYCMDS